MALFRTNSAVNLGSSWEFQWRVKIPLYFGYLLNNMLTTQRVSYLQMQVPQPKIGMTTLYLSVNPGRKAVGQITVESRSSTISISASAVTLTPVYRKTVQLNMPVGTRSYFTMQQLGFDETILIQADIVVFRMTYPFSAFDPEFDYAENVRLVLWVFGWTDLNNDGAVSVNELTWLNYGYQVETAVEVPMAKLSSELAPSQRLVLRADVRPVRSPYPPTVLVKIEVVAHKMTPAPDVQVTPTSIMLRPAQNYSFTVRVVATPDAAPTAYERMVLFNINETTYVVPLSYIVTASMPVNTAFTLSAGRSYS